MSPLPNLAGLIDLIATIPFQHADLHAKDIPGHVYPGNLDLEIIPLPPHSSSALLGDLCAFAVNSDLPRMATRMSPFPDTFTRDPHPDLRADFVMANPPFNIKEWWGGKLEGDATRAIILPHCSGKIHHPEALVPIQ